MSLRSAIRRLEAVLASHPRHTVIHLLGLPPGRADPDVEQLGALIRAALRAGRIRALGESSVAVERDLTGYRFPMPDPPVGPPP